MHGVRLVVAYDGTQFAGFQLQLGQRTVQGELERAAAEMTGHATRMRCAGRTDSGVHALGQVVAFDSERDIPPRGWVRGLNVNLPPDVSVQRAESCAPGYHPRFDTVDKIYRYVVSMSPEQQPLLRQRAWHVWRPLDLARMREAAAHLPGRHDFRAFAAVDDGRKTTVRRIYTVDLVSPFEGDESQLAIVVRGDAFLKNMVRILAGTLVDVGVGKLSPDDVPRMLGPDALREHAGRTAPPHGLTLVSVTLGRRDGPR